MSARKARQTVQAFSWAIRMPGRLTNPDGQDALVVGRINQIHGGRSQVGLERPDLNRVASSSWWNIEAGHVETLTRGQARRESVLEPPKQGMLLAHPGDLALPPLSDTVVRSRSTQ